MEFGGPATALRRIITDPVTGQVHELGRARYRPTAAIVEFVQVRDRTVDWQHGD